jgi:uncharacterized protein YvpB
MKIRVPFYKQTNPLNCGPSALKMVLAYFGKNIDIKILEEKTGIKEGKGISTIQIAIASSSLDFKTELYSKHLSFNPENLKLDFYKKYTDSDIQNSEKLIKDAKYVGVKLYEKTLSIKEILKFLTKNTVPIILLDWNLVTNREKEGYQGHFVPIAGYDEKNVYVHNPGSKDTGKFFMINKRIFDRARKANGTDEDLLVIYKPNLLKPQNL